MRSLSLVAAAGVTLAMACSSAAARATDTTAQRIDSLRRDSIDRWRQDSINRAQPGYVIDSILPIDEEIRRFKTRVGGAPVTTLAHGSASRDALVKRIVDDVARADTTDLASAALTPREFIDLVYPTSPYTHRPLQSPPQEVWMQIANPSAAGFKRLLQRRGGASFKLASYSCEPKPDRQGANTLWVNCAIRVYNETGEEVTQHWFGSIIERDGRFKVVGFKNQF